MKPKHFYLTVFILFLIACGSNKSDYFEAINSNDFGHYRGVEIGMKINEVKAIEDENFLKDEMPTYLHYDVSLDMGNSYTVSYDFSSEDELYEIEMNSFFDIIDDAQKLMDDFKEFFHEKYGDESVSEDGYLIWKINNSGKDVEFAMKNESEEYGILVLKIRDLEY